MLHLSYSYVTTVVLYFTHLKETGSNSNIILDVPLSILQINMICAWQQLVLLRHFDLFQILEK